MNGLQNQENQYAKPVIREDIEQEIVERSYNKPYSRPNNNYQDRNSNYRNGRNFASQDNRSNRCHDNYTSQTSRDKPSTKESDNRNRRERQEKTSIRQLEEEGQGSHTSMFTNGSVNGINTTVILDSGAGISVIGGTFYNEFLRQVPMNTVETHLVTVMHLQHFKDLWMKY